MTNDLTPFEEALWVLSGHDTEFRTVGLTGEIYAHEKRLLEIIERAPHSGCAGFSGHRPREGGQEGAPCDCWKAALSREPRGGTLGENNKEAKEQKGRP